MMLTGISGSKHWRRTSITSSGFTVASGAISVVTAGCSLMACPVEGPRPSTLSCRRESYDVFDAQRNRHLGGDCRALAGLAHEDRLVLELLTCRVGQDRAQHDVPRAWHVAFVPLPVLSDVDHVVAVVDELFDLIQLEIAKRRFLLRHTSITPRPRQPIHKLRLSRPSAKAERI